MWLFVMSAIGVGLTLGILLAAEAPDPAVVLPAQYEARLIALDRQAIEDAYKHQITHLFVAWMKDPTGQPERAVRGANQARRAYAGSMAAIDRREQQQRIPMPPIRPKKDP